MEQYEQMELDLRLDYEKSLKDNIQTVVRFNQEKYMEECFPSPVKNHHERYGVLSEQEADLLKASKQVTGDMSTFLKLLPNGVGDAIGTCGSIYNSCVMVAVSAVKMATQAKRSLDDLYAPTPIEQMLDETEAEDGFEEAGGAPETEEDLTVGPEPEGNNEEEVQ